MYHFFVEQNQISEKEICILGQDVNHIKNVLRMKTGEEVSVSNGVDGNEYRAEISEIYEDRIICKLMFVKKDGVELPSRVTLFQGLPKGDKMEMIIQKAVELGATEIVPVDTKRCVMKLDEKKEKNKIARWQAIAEAAAKQSKRAIVPQIHSSMKFAKALEYCKDTKVKLIPYEMAEDMSKTREIMNGLKPGEDIAIFIGPEGGFDTEEIEKAMAAGVLPITLGKRILRTETAGMTVLSIIMYHLEDM